MWKTIKYSKDGSPLWDVNEQGKIYSYKTQTLVGSKNRDSYPYYKITDEGITTYVHILVAKAFPEICGEWFEGCEVHHKDGNSLNNKPTNLIVCTKEEHIQYHYELKKKEQERLLEQENKKNKKEKKIKEYKKSGNYTICYYCRKSKVRKKDGLAPIEVSLNKKGKRFMYSSGFYAKPNDVKKGKLPEGFSDYLKTLS